MKIQAGVTIEASFAEDAAKTKETGPRDILGPFTIVDDEVADWGEDEILDGTALSKLEIEALAAKEAAAPAPAESYGLRTLHQDGSTAASDGSQSLRTLNQDGSAAASEVDP